MTKRYYEEIEERLYTAVLHDVLDELGYPNQALPRTIRPLSPEMRMAGRAATVLTAQVTTTVDSNPYELLLEFADSIGPGEVVVGTTSSSAPAALWGEIMSTAARLRGARGVIFDGDGRDAAMLIKMGFPSFFTGLSPAGAAGRVKVRQAREPIFVGGVLIADGDLVVGDIDGCLVVPRDIEQTVIDKAMEKVKGENGSRRDLLTGMPLVDVYEKHGVL